MTTIRLAIPDDIPAINRLYLELFSTESVLQPQFIQATEQDVSFIEKSIEDESSIIVVVQNGDDIVGFALAVQQETPPYRCVIPHKYAYLMDICVAQTFRGKGFGTMLINKVKEWATELHLDYVELNVLSNNPQGIRLYEREGFESNLLTMRCIL